MTKIPTRLVVIQARIPIGESCNGCEFDLLDYGECQLHPELVRGGSSSGRHRLPACRERDGWAALPPGSGVPELVEAAKRFQFQTNPADLIVAARKVAEGAK